MEPKPVKKKMQNVNFRSVDEFLEFLPEEELQIVSFLRQIVLDAIPNCKERLAYNVPFYRRRSNVCFIWPSSIMWGNMKNRGVRFGFSNGYLLKDESNFLDKGNRKQIYWKDFYQLSDINVDLLKSFIYEAVVIDQEKFLKKQNKFGKSNRVAHIKGK